MVRRTSQQVPGPAGRGADQSVRHDLSRMARPISTGNLLADCERWCRDHLPHRHRTQPSSPDRRRPRS